MAMAYYDILGVAQSATHEEIRKGLPPAGSRAPSRPRAAFVPDTTAGTAVATATCRYR